VEVSGGVAVDDIGGLLDDGGTEVGSDGEGDGVGEEVTGGTSEETGDDIRDDGEVALVGDVEGGLEEKQSATTPSGAVGVRTAR